MAIPHFSISNQPQYALPFIALLIMGAILA
jgi:hypothetical protein